MDLVMAGMWGLVFLAGLPILLFWLQYALLGLHEQITFGTRTFLWPR
jgi:hypothetical protein